MPDITMCNTKDYCTQKENCYRYKAESGNYQSYAAFKPVIMFGGTICENYWPLDKDWQFNYGKK